MKEMKSLNQEVMRKVVETDENDETPNRKIIVATNGNKVLPKISCSVVEYRLKKRKKQTKKNNNKKQDNQRIQMKI